VTAPLPDALVAELTVAVEEAVDRHFRVAKDWMPHEYVPWELGRSFGDEPYHPSQSPLPLPVRTALSLNLLTEDNLPSYTVELHRTLGKGEAWRAWVDRWTAEEGRHGIVLRDYMVVTRAVDPDELERERMATVSEGYRAPEKDMLRTLSYVSMQELATRVSHRGTGLLSAEPALDKLLQRVATDENLHHVFYRSLVARALEVSPTLALEALAAEAESFAMPGTGIPGFARKAAIVARAGVYDLRTHRDDVLAPLFRHWKIEELTGLDDRGEQARQRLVDLLDGLEVAAAKQETRRPRNQVLAGAGR
jgi:acyl-[acyl-carrier-protein] desaturase